MVSICINSFWFCVEAPGAGAGGGEIEEDEAEEDGRIAIVEQREETVRRVTDEISGGQEACQDESSKAGEETEDNQKAADNFQRTSQAHEGENFDAIGEILGGWEIEIFRCSMFKKEQTGHDAQGGMKMARP